MIWFVCLNKLECLKNVETFQTPTFSPKTCCLRFPNKLCKRIHDVSLRFVGNSSSECLQTVAIFHHRETNQTKLLRSMSIKTPSSEVKKMNSTNQFFVLFVLFIDEGYGKCIDFPFHSTNSKLHCILRAIKVGKGVEKHIVVRFRHLQ